MIKTESFGEIVQVMMGRELDGSVLYWTTAYLIDGLLIDSGCAHTAEELIHFLEGEEVEQVVNTHHHEDHIGANSLLQSRRDLPIYAHSLAVPLINSRLPLREYQEMVWGYPEPSVVQPLPKKLKTDRYLFEIIETPGHSADHISLFERENGWCFTGDLFVSEDLKMLRADEDIDGITASLEKLLALGTEDLTLFTSLGRVFTGGRKAITAFLDHIHHLRNRVVGLAGENLAAPEIRDRIFGRETQLAPLTGGHFSRLNLVEQLMPDR